MPQAKLEDLLRYLRKVCTVQHGRDLSDSELLDRFLTEREDAAFTVLVQRHGPMVLGVCQRAAGDSHLAEDAFQATFMVLAKRAASIKKKGFVAGWLHAVAHRTALKARAELAQRRFRERRSIDMASSEPLDEFSLQELRCVLDEEISRLPEKCRAAVVLCYFEGKSHDQAAQELGWPRTSLTSRLAKAREMLRRQLTGRGVALTSGLLATTLCAKATAAPVKALLTINTVKAAACVAAGKTLAAACLSARAIALTEEAMKATIGGLTAKIVAVVVAASVVAGGIGLAGYGGSGQGPQPPKPNDPPPLQAMGDAAAKDKDATFVSNDQHGDPLPAGAVARLGTLRLKHDPEKRALITRVVYSADGKMISSIAETCRLWEAATGKDMPGPWNEGRCTAVAFSPDGTIMATATPIGAQAKVRTTVTLWDIANTKALKTLELKSDVVGAVVFKDGGKKVVAAGGGVVHWWDVASGKEEGSSNLFGDEKKDEKTEAKKDEKKDEKMGEKNAAKKQRIFAGSAFSPDGRYLAFRTGWMEPIQITNPNQPPQPEVDPNRDVVVFDLSGAKEPWRVKQRGQAHNPLRLAFSADGKRIAIATAPGKVEIRDTSTGKLLAMPPLNPNAPVNNTEWIGAVALTPDGNTVAVAGQHSRVTLWSPNNPTLLRKITGRMTLLNLEPTHCMTYSPDGKHLLVAADSDMQIYDTATLSEVNPWEGHRAWVHHVAFSPNGKQLFTGSAQVDFHPKEVIRWDTTTWKAMHMTSHRSPHLGNIGISSPEHSWYVGRDGEDRFNLYDMINGARWGRLPVEEKQDPKARGFFSPGTKYYVLAGVNDKKVHVERVYAIPSGKFQCELPDFMNYREGMRPIAFSPDDKLVAMFARGDGRIHIFDIATGKRLHRVGQDFGNTADFHCNLTFSQDSNLLASWNKLDNAVRIWDLKTGRERMFLPDAAVTNRAYFAWSPDGRTLAVADRKIQVWELATLKVRREFSGHKIAVFGVAFSPDGRLLASCGVDSTVLVWDTAKPDPVKATAQVPVMDAWPMLGSNDAGKAFAAMCNLTAAKADAVALIKQQVKPAVRVEVQRIEELIGQLDSDQFKVREIANKQLLEIGGSAAPIIDKALAGNPPLETRLRLENLRARTAALLLQGDSLKAFRALEVLERIGTPEAQQVLQVLADGAPGALLTGQAQGALDRLKR